MVMNRLFKGSLALLCLMLAYHLGVTTTHGQSGASVVDADDPGRGSFVVTTTGDVYYGLYLPNGSGAQWTLL